MSILSGSMKSLCSQCAKIARISAAVHCSIYEPPYLDRGPQVENYSALTIRMRAYDYPALESFAKYVHRMTESFGLNSAAYAVPTRSGKVTLYKPNSAKAEQEYTVKLYERTVKVTDFPSTVVPMLLEIFQCNIPEGVQITVKKPETQEDDFRFVPDTMLTDLRKQVEESADAIREYRGK